MIKILKYINETIKSIGFYGLFYDIYSQNKHLLCSHEWEYWHMKLRCDHHHIDGRILHNNIRRCTKCSKQQSYKMVPNRWVENSTKLPRNDKFVEVWVNVLGKKNKFQDRNDKLNSLLKNTK